MSSETVTIVSHTPDGQPSPQTVSFVWSYSIQGGTAGITTKATWVWGDGTPNTVINNPPVGQNITTKHTFNTKAGGINQLQPAGVFNPTLTLTDSNGGSGSANVTVNVAATGIAVLSTTPIVTPAPGSQQFVDPTGLPGAFSIAPGAAQANVFQGPNLGRDTSKTGPSNSKTSITCGIANAKILMKKIAKGNPPSNAAYNIGSVEPTGGFFSVLPISGPDNINQPLPVSGSYGAGYFLTDQNNNPRSLGGLRPSVLSAGAGSAGAALAPVAGSNPVSSGAQSLISEPLFAGTYHVVVVNFTSQAGVTGLSVDSGDIGTILAYLKSIIPLQQQYCSQWGSCSAALDPNVYNADFVIQNNQFNDAALAGNYTSSPTTPGFIDNLATTLGFSGGGPTAHCFIVIAPPGVLNSDCNPANGYLGYHSATAVNNIPYIYVPLTTTGLTSNDAADIYQIALSHEIAESIVDPAADLNNPEVCDSCGPNCQAVIRNYYDQNGNYIVSSALFIAGSGPGFNYAFMTNSVSAPPYATTGSNTCPNLPFNYCGYAPSNQQSNPGGPISQVLGPQIGNLLNPDGTINLLFPNGVTLVGNLVQMPSGAVIIKLPIGS